MGYKFVRGWDFDGSVRLLSTTDLDTAGDPNSDMGEALQEVLAGVGISVGAPTLETLGGDPVVKIGKAGGGTALSVDDSAVIDFDAAAASRNGYLVGSLSGGIEVGASDEVDGAAVVMVILRSNALFNVPLTARDDLIIESAEAAETARIEAESGAIVSPTITQLADAITAIASQTYVRNENEPRVYTGDIQPTFAVDGDLWGRSEPL